jgi:hypothetical protein
MAKHAFKGNELPIDPNVKIPAAVARAAAAADERQRSEYSIPADTPPAPEPVEATINIIEPPPPTPAPGTVTSTGNVPSPTDAPPTPPTPPTSTPPVSGPNDETWEHKFNSVNGRYQQAMKLNEQLTARVNAMSDMLEQLSKAPPTPAQPTAAPATPDAPLLTQKEIEDYGPDMLDVMGRRAAEVVTPEIKALRQQLADLANKLDGTTSTVLKTTKQSMMSSLDQELPRWREVNDMPEFKAWLALPDIYSGAIRHQMLLQAWDACETNRVLAFFKSFVSELAATTPAPDGNALPAPATPVRPSLEQFAAPGRARTPAGTPPPAEKQIITKADIESFYAAKRKGLYRGREDEFNALEQELFRAQREGRVEL